MPRSSRTISASTSSATLRVLENGALNTGIPRSSAAARSTWLVPIQKQPTPTSRAALSKNLRLSCVAKYRELSAAGKLSKEDAASQAAALAQMPAAMSALMTHYIEEINRKNDQAGEDLVGRTAAQAEQTYAAKSAAWEREIDLMAEGLG